MASCVALPREGHLEMLRRVFSLIKNNHNAEILFTNLNQVSMIVISKEMIRAAQRLAAQLR